MMWIRFATIQAFCIFAFAGFANSAELSLGRGNLAAKAGDGDWHCLQLGDSIPPLCQLRTSPAGPVQITLSQTEIHLAGDTNLSIDLFAKRIILDSGRVHLRVAGGDGDWTVSVGGMTLGCASGSEAEISFAETIGVNILKDPVTVSGPKQDSISLLAPLEWVCDDQGNSNRTIPENENWPERIRRRTQPQPEQGLGQLLTKEAESNNLTRMEVAQFHVNVTLKPPLALIQIDQSFYNKNSRQDEGTFVFNLPDGASVSRFAMYVTPSEMIEGELIDRTRANEVYTTIVRGRRDPAILEQIGDNQFRMRIFPILARDTKRILLDYTVPLESDHGRYHFDLPLMSDLPPVWDFAIRGVITPPFKANSAASPTHPLLKFAGNDNGELMFALRERDYSPPGHFSIDYRAPEQSEPFVRTFVSDSKDQYFAVTLPASANPLKENVKPPPSDILVLLDTSESASDLKRARLAVRTLVQNLRPDDRCQIGCVDLHFRPITKEWLIPRSASLHQALKQLDDAFAMGGSKLDSALLESLSQFASAPQEVAGAPPLRRRVIVYIGDGVATIDSSQSCWMDRRLQPDAASRIEFHGVAQYEGASAGAWLKSGVRACQGRLFTLKRGTQGLGPLFEWALSGMPSAPHVLSVKSQNVPDFQLFHDPDWPVGREFHLYGKLPAQKTLDLQLNLSKKIVLGYRLRLDEPSWKDPFAGRQWAARMLDSLLVANNPKTSGNRQEIVRLCQEWSLMSPFTAFLVLESDKDYERWNITRSLRQKYWKPATESEGIAVHTRLMELAQDQVRNKKIMVDTQAPWRASRVVQSQPRAQPSPVPARHRLELARQALADKNPSAAMNHLSLIPQGDRAVDAPLYEAISAKAREVLRRDSILDGLKLRAALIDRNAGEPLPLVSPLFLGLPSVRTNPEYEERHPHFARLMRPTPDLGDEMMPLRDFARQIKTVTGLPVIVDVKAMSDEGISVDIPLVVRHLKGVPMLFAIEQAVSPALIAMIPEGHLIRLTTRTAADEMHRSCFYSIKDFISANTMPRLEQLANPVFDENYLLETAIKAKLDKSINVNLDDVRLEDAIELLLGDIPHYVDARGMSDEGIGVDSPVTFHVEGLPLEVALRHVLETLGLDFDVCNGVLRITTKTVTDERFETRIYSAAGIIDENQAEPIPANRYLINGYGYGYGNGWGSMGMGGMGGFGGSMGGMGGAGEEAPAGGMFGGGGGMGGAMMGGMRADEAPATMAAPGEIHRIAVPDLSDDAEAEPEEKSAPDDRKMQRVNAKRNIPDVVQIPNRSYVSVIGVLRQMTSGKWDDLDGEGGSLEYEPASRTLVVRQTQKVHREIKEVLARMRKSSDGNRRGMRTIVPAAQDAISTQYRYLQLSRIIHEFTGGKWEDRDGEGGSITFQEISSTLAIRCTERDHEAIDQLLVQLRRARFVSQMIPWMKTLDGIDDLLVNPDCPEVTVLPRNSADEPTVRPSLDQNMKLLSVRKSPAWLNQHWRHHFTTSKQTRQITVCKQGPRMEFEFPDRTIRIKGRHAAIAYPGLTIVELDLWGDACRQIADAAFPWLPHLSNAEIAHQFDVVQESEDDREITLRLMMPHCLDTYLQIAFSKQTGQPVTCRSFLAGQAVYDLRFEPKRVVAVDLAGNELEQWELVSNGAEKSVSALDENWGDFILIEPFKQMTPLVQARKALREGRLDAARTIFEAILKQQPRQPFVNFLYAWSLRLTEGEILDSDRLERVALRRVAEAGPHFLMEMMTPSNFPKLGNEGILAVLSAVPEASRTDDLWNAISGRLVEQGEFAMALNAIERAIDKTTDQSKLMPRQLTRIELLIQNLRVIEADTLARSLIAIGLSPNEVLELGDLFGRAKHKEQSHFYFEHYRNLPNQSRRNQIRANIRQGDSQSNNELRWQGLIDSIVELDESPNLVDVVADEAITFDDAKTLGKLATNVNSPTIRRKLMQRQLAIDAPPQRADLALKLLKEKILSEHEITDLVEILTADHRSQAVVEILEGKLKRGELIGVRYMHLLADSYLQLGRMADFERAESGEVERRDASPTPPRW